MRWRQTFNEETGKHEMVPCDAGAVRRDSGAAIHGKFEPFKSPVDGSVISTNKQLRDHNERNNVVQTSEFGENHWNEKRKERERLYTGERTPEKVRRDRVEIYENLVRHEREG
jgi:hypothetical protein